MPRVESLTELNALLKDRCQAYLTRTQARQSQTVGELLQAEQTHLLPLPDRMPECCRIMPVKANRFAMVQFPPGGCCAMKPTAIQCPVSMSTKRFG